MAKKKASYAFTGDELATILHGLRIVQEGGRIEGCTAAMCDHFDGWKQLTDKQIDKLCERINPLDTEAEPAKPTEKELRYIETAREMIAGGTSWDGDEIEIDDGPDCNGNYPKVSEGTDPGAWVQAWVWVTNDDACICRECGEPYADGGDGFDGMCGECADKAEPTKCDDCGKEVKTVIGCPDGAEICQECFDGGKH